MNEKLLNQLIETRQPLFSFIRALARNTHDAEDIFQETASVIIEQAGKNTEVENFKAWSFEIARRKTLEFMRKNHPAKEVQLPAVEMEELVYKVSSNHLSHKEDISEKYSALVECMQDMPEKNRNLIRLRFREDKPFSEIAEASGRTESAIYKAMTKIRIALAECIERKLHINGKES